MSDAAQNLYGSPDPAAAPAAPVNPHAADEAIAGRLYGPPTAPPPREDTPGAVKELRAGDMGRRLYADSGFEREVRDGALDVGDVRINHTEARLVMSDIGLEAEDATALSALARTAETATEADRTTWQADSRAMLASRGFNDRDLAMARELIGRDPRVAQYLDRTGLGNHPRVVERAILLARSAKARGKL